MGCIGGVGIEGVGIEGCILRVGIERWRWRVGQQVTGALQRLYERMGMHWSSVTPLSIVLRDIAELTP